MTRLPSAGGSPGGFQIPEIAVAALRDLVLTQAAARAEAGTAWKENDLVFCTRLGGPMYATDVRKASCMLNSGPRPPRPFTC